jgi:hypothetical protein
VGSVYSPQTFKQSEQIHSVLHCDPRAGHSTFIYKLSSQTNPKRNSSTTQNALHSLPRNPHLLHHHLRSNQFVPHPLPLPSFTRLTPHPAAAPQQPNPNDVTSILEALREVNPEDAEAAASVMQIKLRGSDAEDLSSILVALEEESPEDARAAREGGSVGSGGY